VQGESNLGSTCLWRAGNVGQAWVKRAGRNGQGAETGGWIRRANGEANGVLLRGNAFVSSLSGARYKPKCRNSPFLLFQNGSRCSTKSMSQHVALLVGRGSWGQNPVRPVNPDLLFLIPESLPVNLVNGRGRKYCRPAFPLPNRLATDFQCRCSGADPGQCRPRIFVFPAISGTAAKDFSK
jgi:hypothetical protein